MSIRKSTPPNMIGAINIPLQVKNDYEQLIWNKGYEVVIENAVECPCKGRSGAALTTCMNCLGLGWVFVNPVLTHAIITSANASTKYKHWSPELVGTINITVRDEERLGLMDKISFKTKTNILSEVRPLIVSGANNFIFCSYKVNVIRSIYLFNSETTLLTKLNPNQYRVKADNDMVVQFLGVTFLSTFNGAVSIEYEYLESYNVVDIPHSFRSAFITDNNGKNQEYPLPVQAIGRKSQYVMGKSTNYAGTNLLDNSNI